MTKSSKVISIIVGILLVFAGIWAFVSPLVAFIAIEYVCAAVLIVTGIASIINYVQIRKTELASGWPLFDGILSILCGLIFCFSRYNEAIFAISVSVALGIWLMFMGISQCSMSMKLKSAGTSGWGWITALGVISIICSITVFVKPIGAAIGTSTFLLGFLLIVAGISFFSRCFVKKSD